MPVSKISSVSVGSQDPVKTTDAPIRKPQDTQGKSSLTTKEESPSNLWRFLEWVKSFFVCNTTTPIKEDNSPKLIEIASKNGEILKKGTYKVDGVKVTIGKGTTVPYDYKGFIEGARPTHTNRYHTEIKFLQKDTIEAYTQELEGQETEDVVMLNMASGTSPAGGGYLKGNKTQEPELCRRIPNLYPALCQGAVKKNGEYKATRKEVFQEGALLTTGLCIARDKNYNLLKEPIEKVHVISAAALDRSKETSKTLSDEEIATLKNKAKAILLTASENRYETLILGAWGCGSFNHDPKQVAQVFKELLDDEFQGTFQKIAFAIPDQQVLKTFQEVFEKKLKQE